MNLNWLNFLEIKRLNKIVKKSHKIQSKIKLLTTPQFNFF